MGNSPMRMRTALVVGVTVVTVVTASSLAGAHEGTDGQDVLHGCVNDGSGLVRVVSATSQDCRRGETPVHWPLSGGSADELADFMQRLLDEDNADDLAHWNNLAGVPSELTALLPLLADGLTYDDISGVLTLPADSVDGATVVNGSLTSDDIWDDTLLSADIADGTLTGSDVADGTLTGSDVADGTLTGSDVADGTLTGSDVADGMLSGFDVEDGSLTASDLAGEYAGGTEVTVGAVTGEKIADGTVANRDLAPGAVTPDKTSPVVQSGSGSSPIPLTVPQSLPSPGVAVDVGPDSLVMVSGQVQVNRGCSVCIPGAEYVVEYQVTRNGVPVGPEYRLELSADHRFDVASVSVLDSGFSLAGPATYAIRLEMASGGVDVQATDAVLTAQVLGVQ